METSTLDTPKESEEVLNQESPNEDKECAQVNVSSNTNEVITTNEGIVDIEEIVSKDIGDDNEVDKKSELNLKKSEGCYIASAVYGSYDSSEVIVLRRFRDRYLLKKLWGQKLVEIYYKYSPQCTEKLRKHVFLNAMIKKVLDIVVRILKHNTQD